MKKFSSNKPITALHVGIAKELFKWIDAHRQDKRPITYGQLAELVGINPQNLRTYLGDLSTECHVLKLPLISAVVVSVDTNVPGTGFYDLALSLGYSNLEIEEVQGKVFYQKDWQTLKDKLGL